jgi:hypothetical protein
MKIKTNYYGIFYWNHGKWNGPLSGQLIDEKAISRGMLGLKEVAREWAKAEKKKTKIFREVWKEV